MSANTTQPKNKKLPRLRFPGFQDAWVDKSLGSFLTERSEYPKEKYPLYSLTIENGITPKTDRYERSFLLKSVGEAYKVVHPNDFAYNPMNLRFGALARHKDTNKVLVSKYYNIFYGNEDVDPGFLEAFLTSDRMIQFYNRMATGSLEEKKRVHYLDFVNFEKPFPTISEQKKIATFLDSVNEWLSNMQKQKESFVSYKKAMIQKIFSQEIHCKDEDGKSYPKWVERKLSDCLEYEQPTEYIVTSTEYDDSYKTPVLTAGKSFILGHTNETSGIFKEGLPVIIFDDFTTTSQFVDFPFKVKSSAMKILRAKSGTDIKFIHEAMRLIKYKIGGHGRHWISEYANFKIMVPSLPEQKKISVLLASLDDLIESKHKQIEYAEQWKKGLMQQLFI
jgi:type I restriction enzyme S subunit